MRAKRIKTGFHRFGLVLAAPCALVAAIFGGVALYTVATMPSPEVQDGVLRRFAQNNAEGQAWWAAGAAVLGALVYGVARALGWIFAGVAGDGENSN